MSIYRSYSEEQLLLHVASKDEQAFTELVNRYRDNIYTTALRLVHRRVLAEEVLQDVFLKVWLNAATLPELDNFPAWLNRVARNTIYTAFRQSLKENIIALDETTQEISTPFLEEDRILDKEYTSLLRDAVASLPPRQQQAWRLIREEGKKRAEAAAELNISPETVKFHLEAAVRNVRAYCLSRLPAAIAVLLMGLK